MWLLECGGGFRLLWLVVLLEIVKRSGADLLVGGLVVVVIVRDLQRIQFLLVCNGQFKCALRKCGVIIVVKIPCFLLRRHLSINVIVATKYYFWRAIGETRGR